MKAVKKKLQDELDLLERELHFKLPKDIQHAREFGDLKENAEYKAAKERQTMVQARISQLQQRLILILIHLILSLTVLILNIPKILISPKVNGQKVYPLITMEAETG